MGNTIKLAVIPGDGIGQEVVAEGLKVMGAALAGSGIAVDKTEFNLGADLYFITDYHNEGPVPGNSVI